jgi:glycosyltransferase involved in cell wall biosynthesis
VTAAADIPLVTAIVPAYNAAAVVGRCVKSLLAQTWPRVEILVADDGSTDGTAAAVPAPARVVPTGGRKGAGGARNAGAREAKGEVLFFTDADVVAPPDWIEKAMRVRAEKGVRCGGGGYAGPVREIFMQQFAHEELVWRRRGHKGCVETLVSNNLWCDRDVFWEVGGFPEFYKVASSEDLEFSWTVSRRHKLWWDEGNGVFHDFTPTLRAYLRQQSRFARDAVPMVVHNRHLLNGRRTHHGRQLHAELAFTAAGCVFPPAWLGVWAVNVPFLRQLARKRGQRFAWKALGAAYLRNFAALWGLACGAWWLATGKFGRDGAGGGAGSNDSNGAKR